MIHGTKCCDTFFGYLLALLFQVGQRGGDDVPRGQLNEHKADHGDDRQRWNHAENAAQHVTSHQLS